MITETRLQTTTERVEAVCLLCGRGTGPGGVLLPMREVPDLMPPCAYCGGFMLTRPCFTIEREKQLDRHSYVYGPADDDYIAYSSAG